MKLIKFEKHNCPKCVMVQNFLDDKGIEFKDDNKDKAEKIDVENYSDLDFISKYVDFSLPVVVLLDDNGELVKKSVGFEPAELEEIVSQLQ
jgi:thioredoxin 1